MQYRRFGKTELNLPVFTLGAMRIPFKDEGLEPAERERRVQNAVDVCRRAVEEGINHFETARGYGNSEELIGEALKVLNRDEIIITTKIGPAETESQMREWIEASLQRMGIDHIDNFDIHGINTREKLQQAINPKGTWRAVEKALDEGIIRHIGFSTHGPLDVILETINTQLFESINLHYYYFFQRNRPAVERARELDMGIFIISPTDKGGQLFKPPARLSTLCLPYTAIQISHRFLLSQADIHTLSLGAAHPDEIDAHISIADEPAELNETERKVLQRLDRNMVESLNGTYCSVCGDCLPCPENINIPEALRLRNMAKAFDMTDYGRYRYNMFQNAGDWFPGNKANTCTDCGDCLPRCPLHLKIPDLLRETHDALSGEAGKRLWAE